jgi:hypothetical protein
VIVGFLSVLVGLILDGITKSRREVARLMYLQLPAVGVDR